MTDMKLIVKLLGIISEQEKAREYNPLMFNEHCIGCPQAQIDCLAKKLQDAGYVSGLMTTEDIDNCDDNLILWELSKPSITLAGIEYMETNSAFLKAKKSLSEAMISTGKTAISILLGRFLLMK